MEEEELDVEEELEEIEDVELRTEELEDRTVKEDCELLFDVRWA